MIRFLVTFCARLCEKRYDTQMDTWNWLCCNVNTTFEWNVDLVNDIYLYTFVCNFLAAFGSVPNR